MNERIKELADQAGLGILNGGIVLTKNVNAAEAFNQFAELIVQECAQVCNDVDAEYDGEDVLATWCAQAINKHFGIE